MGRYPEAARRSRTRGKSLKEDAYDLCNPITAQKNFRTNWPEVQKKDI
jgi:hypothetical protein